jgi:hypothetical protein
MNILEMRTVAFRGKANIIPRKETAAENVGIRQKDKKAHQLTRLLYVFQEVPN